MDRGRKGGNVGNYITRTRPRGLGLPADNFAGDMAVGRDIVDQTKKLPITPVPMDKSMVTSTFDSRPVNAVDAYMSSSNQSQTFPPPS